MLPLGEIALKKIYGIVKETYPDLCDDNVLCKDICTQGANQPEWKHRVRTVLYQMKGHGVVEKSNRRGFWIIRQQNNLRTPQAFDLSTGNEEPDRSISTIYRVLRDTKLSRQLKMIHQDRCQICDSTIKLKSGKTYSEAHHIKPLGSEHCGPDVAENIIILCPNHHVMCDYGAIKLNASNLRSKKGHKVSIEYIKYHNQNIYQKGV